MCAHGVLASLTDPGSPPAPSGSVSTTGSILPHGGASGVRGASARWGTPPGLLTAEAASGFVNSCQWFPVSLFPRLLGRRKGSSPPAGGGSRGLAEPQGAAGRGPYHRVHVDRMIPGLITSSLRVFPRPLFLSVVLPVTVGSG